MIQAENKTYNEMVDEFLVLANRILDKHVEEDGPGTWANHIQNKHHLTTMLYALASQDQSGQSYLSDLVALFHAGFHRIEGFKIDQAFIDGIVPKSGKREAKKDQ